IFLGFFITTVTLPAWTMLLYWFGLQFVSGLFGLMASEGGGVAFWAHVGGFVAGMLLIKLFANGEMVREHREGGWQPRRGGARWEPSVRRDPGGGERSPNPPPAAPFLLNWHEPELRVRPAERRVPVPEEILEAGIEQRAFATGAHTGQGRIGDEQQ